MNAAVTRSPASDTTRHDDGHRRRVRLAAMYLSIGVAVIYGLIAANVVTVIDGTAERVAADQLAFAAPAAAIHVIGAILLWRVDHRLLWGTGAILQVMIITMYFVVSPQRDPTFEVWGVTIRVLQLALLSALAYLAARPRGDRVAAAERG